MENVNGKYKSLKDALINNATLQEIDEMTFNNSISTIDGDNLIIKATDDEFQNFVLEFKISDITSLSNEIAEQLTDYVSAFVDYVNHFYSDVEDDEYSKAISQLHALINDII